MLRISVKNTFITLEGECQQDGDRPRLTNSAPQSPTISPRLLEDSADVVVQQLEHLNLRLSLSDLQHDACHGTERIKIVGSSNSLSTMASSPGDGFMPRVGSSGSLAGSDGAVDGCDNSCCSVAQEVLEFDMVFEDQTPAATTMQVSRAIAAPSLAPRASSHKQVPKVVNLEEEYGKASSGAPTTVMIHNIPNLYSQQNLLEELVVLGYGEAFDFLYVPLDMGTKCTVGYGFVNFKDSIIAERFMQDFHGHRFSLRGRMVRGRKVAAVSVAHVQGRENNLRHYQDSAVIRSRAKQRRPIVVDT